MRLKLLDYLKCFNCGGEFFVKDEKMEGEHIESGVLQCGSCAYHAPIVRGIPRLLPQTTEATNKEIAERFAYEWKYFSEFFDVYRGQFLSWIEPLNEDYFKNKVVLDAGCGKGRHVRLAAEFGARDVVGFDLSESVEVAYQVTKDMPNVHIVQADIFHAPFKKVFDYAYSIGVIDHTIDPERAFRSVASFLKPGGSISTWVYGKEGNGWVLYLIDPLRKAVTSKAPLWFVKALASLGASILHPVINYIYKPLDKTALRKFLFYREYLMSISHFPKREMASITFDHLVAPEAYYLTKEEVTAWYERENLKNILITRRNKNSWRGFGIRPYYQYEVDRTN